MFCVVSLVVKMSFISMFLFFTDYEFVGLDSSMVYFVDVVHGVNAPVDIHNAHLNG